MITCDHGQKIGFKKTKFLHFLVKNIKSQNAWFLFVVHFYTEQDITAPPIR